MEKERKKKRQRKLEIPCEVIYTILSKLPVKSLLRFRCVCKQWRALISEPRFIKSHLVEATKSDRCQKLLCSAYKSESFHSVDPESSCKSQELCFPIKKYRKARVLCSCNGFVLLGLRNDKMNVLWNPSTRTYTKFSCPHYQTFGYGSYGICYNSSIDDYKVVFITNASLGPNLFVVYTFKNNSWTEIRQFPHSIQFFETGSLSRFRCENAHIIEAPACRSGVAINGVPHWVMTLERKIAPTAPAGYNAKQRYRQNYYNNYVIVYFDFVEENFKEVPPPNWIQDGHSFYLAVIRGCLSLCISTKDLRLVEVWTMKEYGERNSWAKIISIPCYCDLLVLPAGMNPIDPLCLTKEGEVGILLCQGRSKLVLCNCKENTWRNITPATGDRWNCSAVVSYVDTLVLPTRDKLKNKQ